MNNQTKQVRTAQDFNFTITVFVNESLFSYVIVRHYIVVLEESIHPLILLFFNQVFVQTECRMKVCAVSVLFPVLLCVVIQRHGGNLVNVLSSFHRSVCLCFCVSGGLWFLIQTSMCLPRGYI